MILTIAFLVALFVLYSQMSNRHLLRLELSFVKTGVVPCHIAPLQAYALYIIGLACFLSLILEFMLSKSIPLYLVPLFLVIALATFFSNLMLKKEVKLLNTNNKESKDIALLKKYHSLNHKILKFGCGILLYIALVYLHRTFNFPLKMVSAIGVFSYCGLMIATSVLGYIQMYKAFDKR